VAQSYWAGRQLTAERGDADGATYRHLYGPGGTPCGRVWRHPPARRAPAPTWPARAGSVVGLTDISGTVIASYTYDPWGNLPPSPGRFMLPHTAERVYTLRERVMCGACSGDGIY